MNKRKLFILVGVFLVIALAVAFLLFPVNRLWLETPSMTFSRLVADPVPDTVTNIEIDGIDTRYQSSVTISFEASPADMDKILKGRSYQRKRVDSQWTFYEVTARDGLNSYTLSIDSESKRGFFTYFAS